MKTISNIHLNNFRSYEETKFRLAKNINIFIGKNGQGKTNLLEAIYFISNIRSHRTRNDKDLIKNNNDFSRIIVEVVSKDKKEKLMCVIHSEGKYFSINDNTVAKTSDMLGRINTILFYPNETKIFSDTPSSRRTFFDVEIGKVSKNYTNTFQEFNKLLKNRNKVLKEEEVDLILLNVITRQLIENQLVIIKERQYLVNYINKRLNSYLQKLSNQSFKIDMKYVSTIKELNLKEQIIKYEDNFKRDKFNGITTEGIHRDDFEFYTNGIEITKYLSQGQTRLVLLAIKFVLIDYIIDKTNQTPILLLDDVLSELDEDHQINLIENIPKHVQTIITATNDHEIFNQKNIKKFIIKASKIIKEEDFYGRY